MTLSTMQNKCCEFALMGLLFASGCAAGVALLPSQSASYLTDSSASDESNNHAGTKGTGSAGIALDFS